MDCMNMINQLEAVQAFLDDANSYNLSAECVVTAINLVRDNPEADLVAVLEQALASWDVVPYPSKEWLEEYGPYE